MGWDLPSGPGPHHMTGLGSSWWSPKRGDRAGEAAATMLWGSWGKLRLEAQGGAVRGLGVGKAPAAGGVRGGSKGAQTKEESASGKRAPSTEPLSPMAAAEAPLHARSGQCCVLETIHIFPGTAHPWWCSHPMLPLPLLLQTCSGVPTEGLVIKSSQVWIACVCKRQSTFFLALHSHSPEKAFLR